MTCPSPADLKNAKFSTAHRIPSNPATTGNNNISRWVIISDDLNIGENKWNLWYIFLTPATNQGQAIQDGTNKFNQKKLNQPMPIIAKNQIMCNYNSDLATATETVNAYSPPMPYMDWVFKPIQLPPPLYPQQQPQVILPNQTMNVIKIPTSPIQGSWKHNQSGTSIQLNQMIYTFCNEDNNCAYGYSSGNFIRVPQWNVTGKLSKDGRYIEWSNGTRWQRN